MLLAAGMVRTMVRMLKPPRRKTKREKIRERKKKKRIEIVGKSIGNCGH